MRILPTICVHICSVASVSCHSSRISLGQFVLFICRAVKRIQRFDAIDQMIQAARTGKQNILEGSLASGTSKKTEVKLTNVARASLEELLEDYRDFLRVRGLRLWEKNSREAMFVRELGRTGNVTYEANRTYIETRPPEVAANIIICLIHQTNYLLDQQIRQLERAFVTEGGLSERMTQARLTERRRK